MRHLMLYLLPFIGLSCNGVGDAPGAESEAFFNLPDWVGAQDSLLGSDVRFRKTVISGAGVEAAELEVVDWEAELAPFAQSDIDKSALWEQYAIQREEVNGNLVTVYTALDSSTYTRLLRVVTDGEDEVLAVDVHNRFESVVAETNQHLSWRPGEFTIVSTQDALLSEPHILRIEGEWDPVGDALR